MLNLICPWRCSHRGTETGAACLSCHLKLPMILWGSVPGASVSPALKIRTSADSWQAEGVSLQSCCSASSAHGTARTEGQRLGLLACLATSNIKSSPGMGVVPARLLRSPASKMQTSPDNSQLEGTSLERCCSASSAHGPARTEAQRVGLLACIVTSIFKAISGGPWRPPSAALLKKCERLQRDLAQKGLA